MTVSTLAVAVCNLPSETFGACPHGNRKLMDVVNHQRIYSVTSWQDCSSRCQAKASCTEWTWWDSTNAKTDFRNFCRLSEGFTFTEHYSSAFFGTRSCQGRWWCKTVLACLIIFSRQRRLAGLRPSQSDAI